MTLISCESGRAHETPVHQLALVEDIKPAKDIFYSLHEKYLEKSITHRRFKHTDIVRILDSLKTNPLFEVKKVGESFQNRDIFLVKAGSGKTKVLLWSQMHGDEPTATMALLDIFKYLADSTSGDKVRDDLLRNTTLYFIPMLNPDGAEVYKRRNALDIDLNRDAVSLQSPESRILKSVRDSLKPDFGFNLHDQNTRYTAGKTSKPATVSFLAPPYDYAKSENEVRTKAMKLIVYMNRLLQNYIPGQVAKYSDEHEPRAFGDNIQKWGTSTVLIESGGYKNDTEKQYIRKLNFVALLNALKAIGQQTYTSEKIANYYKIPENERYLFDLLIRNAETEREGKPYRLDIGIDRYEVNMAPYTNFFYRSSIEEIGDMSVRYGYQELDASGMRLIPGKIYPEVIKNVRTLQSMNIKEILQKGFTTVKIKNYMPADQFTALPINIITGKNTRNHEVILSRSANFVLEQDGQVRYAIINGFIYDLQQDKNEVLNALVN
ncbi:M14 family metallopeptidase [Rhodocytophaga rosea]|nr:M14 metallopeptidase family protein [Rhodocytophaga rosea]